MGKKKKKDKRIDIEDLRRRKMEENIEDAEWTDADGTHHRPRKRNLGTKTEINMRIQDFFRMTEDMKYRTAASKFRKEKVVDEADQATDEDVERLKFAAIDAVKAFVEKANIDKKYGENVIAMLENSQSPEETVKIATAIQTEIGKSEKLKPYREYWQRGLEGKGWCNDPKASYEMDPLYGLPLDPAAAKELGDIYKKYTGGPLADDGWNGYWEDARPNAYLEQQEREAQEYVQKYGNPRSQTTIGDIVDYFVTGAGRFIG